MTTTTTDSLQGSFNLSVLQGVLSSEVRITDLPDGGVVHNFEVKTEHETARHVVPVAWRDPARPPRLEVGDRVVVAGQVRRRWFRGAGGSQSRTEVLADTVARVGSTRARTVLARAASFLVEHDQSGGRRGMHH